MNVEEALAAYRFEGRTLVWPGETLDARPLVTRRSQNGFEENLVAAFALNDDNVDAAIQEEVAYFGGLEKSFEWKAFSFDQPVNLVERLQTAGFAVGDREAIVVYDLQDGFGPFEGDLGCEVRRVERIEQLADFRRVAEAVFKKDYSFTISQLTEALQTGQRGHDAYIAYMDGEPVSVGRLYTNPNSAFAGLYGGGTRPEFRSRGCYRAIVAARARHALASGARYLQVDALPTSLPILKRTGFTPIADTWPCTFAVK